MNASGYFLDPLSEGHVFDDFEEIALILSRLLREKGVKTIKVWV